MRNVTFPGLGLAFYFDPVAFSIGSLEVHWYALIIALGFILAVIYCFRRAKVFGVDTDRLVDIVLGGMIGGIIGARLYFVLFKLDYYLENPLEIFKVWNGGLAIYGGLIGAILVGALVARWRKIKFAPVLDLASLGFLIGQAVGRWGNFINAEAFGCNTSLPWGMSGTAISDYLKRHATELSAYGVTVDPSVPVHPTFFYESLWCIIGFVLLNLYYKRRKFDGEVFLLYSIWYGFGRFIIEGLRTDSLMLGMLRVSQLLAAVIVVVAFIIWVKVRLNIRRDPHVRYATLYVDTQEAQDVLKYGYETLKKKRRENKENQTDAETQAETLSQQNEDDISADEELEQAEEEKNGTDH